MKNSKLLFIFLMPIFLLNFIKAENISSYFGFTTNMPDGWAVISPKKMAKLNAKETIDTLGISDIKDKKQLNIILNKVKSGNVEFYFDKNYLNNQYRNNISVQLSQPILFKSINELKVGMQKQCQLLPKQLYNVFGEEVIIHACQVLPLNNCAVLHHSYTIPSKNITIINEQIPINNKYSIVFAGGSGNDILGLHRLRGAQQSLVEALTKYLNAQLVSKK